LRVAGPVLSKAEGVGEPRRGPKGPCHGQYGFGSFCQNKRASPAGAKPGNTKYLLNAVFEKKEMYFLNQSLVAETHKNQDRFSFFC
jgi:hypothetical protein